VCSFIFTRLKRTLSQNEISSSNSYSQRRGPDKTNFATYTDIHGYHLLFLHNLLDISGSACIQPYRNINTEELITLFNGEIYNFRQFATTSSDTQSIPIAFLKHGQELGNLLDGEYAITIYDVTKSCLHIFTDPFLTKPLYIGNTTDPSELGIATCESSLRLLGFSCVTPAIPNSYYKFSFSMNSMSTEHRFPAIIFDIEQINSNYLKWEESFLSAVEKRAKHGTHQPTVYLSSGYDSGAICLALNLLGIKYTTFSIAAGENVDILKRRIALNSSAFCDNFIVQECLSYDDIKSIQKDIITNVENFKYSHEDSPGKITSLHEDDGAIGVNFISQKARELGKVVTLSGCGADEIMSDYGFAGEKIYHHSQFGGLFPANLNSFFPWKKFYGDTMRSYLFKDEYILGRHGVEGRYPFLDRDVVQQFLSLSPELKNTSYKAPLKYFFDKHNYPYEVGKKRGFSPLLRSHSTDKPENTKPAQRVLKTLIKRFFN
jgi:asparagine synthetase B (glutamine-hydrolysing)